MSRRAYLVVWQVKNKPEVWGYSHLMSDRGLAQLRATMANEDYPHLFHWVEEVDGLKPQVERAKAGQSQDTCLNS